MSERFSPFDEEAAVFVAPATSEAPDARVEQEQENIEYTRSSPEIISNPRLENTTLVYSIPFRGEWKNGQLLRTLESFLSQRTNPGESFEIELIANIGNNLKGLLTEPINDFAEQPFASDTLAFHTKPQDEKQKKTLDFLAETNVAAAFLKKVIEAQRLKQEQRKNPSDDTNRKLEEIMGSILEKTEREILQKAIDRADQVAFVLVDATKVLFQNTQYKHNEAIYSMRTLGADVAAARFEGKEETVFSLYDADTIPQDNHTIRETQKIFESHPRLQYLFSGLTSAVAGTSEKFFASSPSESLKHTYLYNSHDYHGSPQIAFRLGAYNKLKEIAGYWDVNGMYHDEDRDTGLRLMYHFGNLQDGFLFDEGAEWFPPTVLTADRADGMCDSYGRVESLNKGKTCSNIPEDIERLFSFRDKVFSLIEKAPPEQQGKMRAYYEKARSFYTKKEQTQQRMNRVVAESLLKAVEQNLIRISDQGELDYDELEMEKFLGGKALTHYVRSNRHFIQEIIQSPENLQVMAYFVRKGKELPSGITELTPVQQAIREYVGVLPTTASAEQVYIAEKTDKDPKNPDDHGWKVTDLRTASSRESLLHPMVVETLALGATYRAFFQTVEFWKQRASYKTHVGEDAWPENTDAQEIDLHFGDTDERIEEIKRTNPQIQEVEPKNITEVQPTKGEAATGKPWYSRLDIKSFPVFALFQKLFGSSDTK